MNFLIKKDDIANFCVFLIAAYVCLTLLSYLSEKDEEMMVDIERLMISRIVNS